MSPFQHVFFHGIAFNSVATACGSSPISLFNPNYSIFLSDSWVFLQELGNNVATHSALLYGGNSQQL